MAGLVSDPGHSRSQTRNPLIHGPAAKRLRHHGGPDNPLGARALYLWQGKVDTLYRIHGTNEPESIGHDVSAGCIRMRNEDVIDLYERTPAGTKVVVLAGRSV